MSLPPRWWQALFIQFELPVIALPTIVTLAVAWLSVAPGLVATSIESASTRW